MNRLHVRSVGLACAAWLGLLACRLPAQSVSGTFVQLNRKMAEKTVKEWRSDLMQMKAIGMDTLVIQWCAEDNIAYFYSDLPYLEQHDTVERIFEAVGTDDIKVHLGLHSDADYWTQITARDAVLRDYFLVRVARNERVQKALVERFGKRTSWAGYYIPDEIDDLTWRQPGKSVRMREYLSLMGNRLRTNDVARTISVSAFFRGRTAPDVFTETLTGLVSGTALDHVIVQDGLGIVSGPSARYVPLYLKTLSRTWSPDSPSLWCVIEVFRQVSAPGKPFSAVPAPAERVVKQIEQAAPHFKKTIVFTFPDYMDPDNGPESAGIYNALKQGRPGK